MVKLNSHKFSSRKIWVPLAATSLLLILLLLFPAEGAAITDWTLPGASSVPYDLVVDSDKYVWIAEWGSGELSRFRYGIFQEYQLAGGSHPWGLTYDGEYIWYTDSVLDRLGRTRASNPGSFELFNLPVTHSPEPRGIAVYNKTLIWFTMYSNHSIGILNIHANMNPEVTEFRLPDRGGNQPGPVNIIFVEESGAWYTDRDRDVIGQIPIYSNQTFFENRGKIREWHLPDGSEPWDLASDAYGNIWFTESGTHRVGRLNPYTNEVTEFITPSSNSEPTGITIDESNKVWFTERAANKIGRITPGFNTITEFNHAGTGSPFFIVTEYIQQGDSRDPSYEGGKPPVYGRPPIWFTDDAGNKIGKIDPFVATTKIFVSEMSSATSYFSTTSFSSTSLKGFESQTTTSKGVIHSTTISPTTTNIEQIEMTTGSTSYHLTETESVLQTISVHISTLTETTTIQTTTSITTTATSTVFGDTVTNTISVTSSATSTTYIDTVTGTLTTTKTMTTTTTSFITETGTTGVPPVVPGYSGASIIAGFIVGGLNLLVLRKFLGRGGNASRKPR